MFVSHDGDVSPSGFLPLPAGNVRRASAVDLYRDAPLFQALRDETRLGGRCGRCRWRGICGGSRARAFALTGDPLGEEPTCPHIPEVDRPC
jgi:radical SAM protein with 4Fe4S-binding SPASM domain